MPELPEVELVARSLHRLLAGRHITQAHLMRERLAPDTTPRRFAESVSSSRLTRVHRRGKYILFDLDNGRTLITHLRMSGRFMLLGPDRQDPKFTHAAFFLDDDRRLIFQDQRHFGMMKIVATNELDSASELSKLAPEPFSDHFTPEYLHATLRRSKRSIKEFLLDQTKVCGLGNIYAAETLFMAGIHPATRTHRLTKARTKLLFTRIREVLAEAIDAGSTLNVDPENIDASYYGGGYESHWRVYERERTPCSACGSTISRIRQGGRSSYFCSRCQRR